MENKVIWKGIPGYKDYKASNMGLIKSLKRTERRIDRNIKNLHTKF